MVNFVVPGAAGVKEHGNGFSDLGHSPSLLAISGAPACGEAQSPRPLGARDGDNKRLQQLRNRPAPATQSLDRVDLSRMSREERVRFLAESVAKFLPEMADVCSQCTVKGFKEMKIVVSAVKAKDYDKSFTDETLASYDSQTHTATLFDAYFRLNNILQMSTLFHEYLHSFPDNQEIWRKGTQAEREGLHTSRPWEAEPVRLERIFQQRFGQRIMSEVGR